MHHYDMAEAESSSNPTYYLPIVDSNTLLEGCESILRSLVQRIIEGYINGYTNYSDERGVQRIKVTKIEIRFAD